MSALLEAEGITKVFGGGLFDRSRTVALSDFSMAIPDSPPSITAVVGESGSGKTTLARLLLGLATPDQGTVRYQGTDLRKLSGAERQAFRREVQVIFQDPYEVYNPFYKVDHVLETPITNFGLAKGRAAVRSLIEETLNAVGLRPEETLGRYPHQLSGGQRQRVMVARALVLRPRLIIADEPVSMVDASLRATILGSLVELKNQFGISLIYITHDLTTAYQVSENIIVLYRGHVAEAGAVGAVVQHPAHPYTQLLVGSIPIPDPNTPWLAEPAGSGVGSPTASSCAFLERCPHAMEMCISQQPPLYQTEPHRAAACYLHRQHAIMAGRRLDSIFTVGAPATN